MDQQSRQILKRFEADLRQKLEQKCPPTTEHSVFLQKTFKFFDIQNKGAVTLDQFGRAVQKIGVVFANESDLELVFSVYDRSQDGRLDYKEFTRIFTTKSQTGGAEATPLRQQVREYQAQTQGPKTDSSNNVDLNALMTLFRDKIRARGARGIIGLQRIFKIMDDDRSRTISEQEFGKAIKDFRIGISEEHIPTLFNAYDTNRDGTLNIDEFLFAIQGQLNERRLALIQQAFHKIDKDSNGTLDILDIRDSYKANKHPDVLAGKRSEDEILVEFLETFEAHLNMRENTQPDGRVTLDEFTEYYKNISCSIDNDDYFALMMNNSWNLKGDAPAYAKYERGWANEDAKAAKNAKPVEFIKPAQAVHRSGQMSNDNPLVQTGKYYKETTSASRGNTTNTVMHAGPPTQSKLSAQSKYQQELLEAQAQVYPNAQAASSISITGPQAVPKFQTILVERFRKKLQSRGSRGLIGLARQFKIFDDNNSGDLDQYEFTKAIKDFQVGVDDKDIASLFKSFDWEGNGTIDFNEFIRVMVGPLNNFRTQIVIRVFKQIDVNGDGVLNLEDIKGKYNATMHPEVKSGRRTEDEVLTEFLETFEQHHNTIHGNKADGKVTPEEFLEYYAHVSANIDSDAHFELLLSNAWNVESSNNPNSMPFAGSSKKVINVSAREAYRRDHHRNLFGTDKQTPFDKNKQGDWSTTNNGSFANAGTFDQSAAAGGQTFANSGDVKMQFLSESQRRTDVNYRGIQKTDDQLVTLFRQKLAARGARGMIGMQRVFKVMDDNSSGTLDIQEFWKAICDFRLPISPEECRKLFDLFDINSDGEIQYDELMRSVAGEMSPIRKTFVQKAFKKIDKDESGILDIRDIQGTYNAKLHPDVKSGKKTEQEVLSEFLDTFELHYSMNHPGSKDRQVNLKEFQEYYNNVSASIPNDDYFELMITNAWNLNDKTYSKGWGAEH